MARVVRVASAQYPITELTSFAALEAKLEHWVADAAENDAQILLFPEYNAFELARFSGLQITQSVHASILTLQYYLPDYRNLYAELSKRYGVFIISGSAPVTLTNGSIVNRSRIFAPKGASGFQEKDMMTRFEREEWGISSSPGSCVFDLGIARVGIAICYDVEFPLIARSLACAGAEIVLVPSCTDTLAGFHRVRTGCRARAVENQIYTVQSVTVGNAPWSAALEVNVGQSGFFAPSDKMFPPDGVLAEGKMNEPGWVYANLDLDLLKDARENGEVLNFKDWDAQPGASPLPGSNLIPLL